MRRLAQQALVPIGQHSRGEPDIGPIQLAAAGLGQHGDVHVIGIEQGGAGQAAYEMTLVPVPVQGDRPSGGSGFDCKPGRYAASGE